MRIAALLFVTLCASINLYAEPGFVITIAEGAQATVTETRMLDFKSGQHEMVFAGVPMQIDPRSVKLSAPGVTMDRQTFEFGQSLTDVLLKRHLNRSLQVVLDNGDVVEGRLLSSEPQMRKRTNMIVLEMPDRSVRSIDMDHIREIRFPDADGAYTQGSALQWLLNSDRGGAREASVSYTTGGLWWDADYMLTLDTDHQSGLFQGWANVQNNSGMSFPDAEVRLASGSFSDQSPRKRPLKGDGEMGYTEPVPNPNLPPGQVRIIGGRATLADNSQTRLSLFEGIRVPATFQFEYNHYDDPTRVKVSGEIDVKNLASSDQLFPRGLVRVYAPAEDGTESLIGYGALGQTSDDGIVTLPFGYDSDILVRRTDELNERVGETGHRWHIRLALTNAKEAPVTVVVTEYYEGEWEITDATMPYDLCDAHELVFTAPVKAKGEAVVEYTRLRYDYHGPKQE